MKKNLLIIAVLFLVVRILTIYIYQGTYYYYGMVTNQFAIAEAAYNGHWFSYGSTGDVYAQAAKDQRFIPIEEWKNYPKPTEYKTFPAQDLPGYGYLIALTSKYFSDELTSRYAFALQVLLELISILLFVYCVSLVFGQRTAFISGLLYIFAYPFIWPIASQPMRDIFVLGVYSFCLAAFFIFSKRDSVRSFLLASLFVAIAALLLWVRPSGYYFFFVIAPFVLFLKHKDIKVRAAFLLVMVLVPLFIFGLPLKSFNQRHYGITDTGVLGRGLWQGMGIIKDNPYGFVLDDGALVPWCKSQGHDVAYSSPEMNKILGVYARDVIKEDPVYYLRTVARRCKYIAVMPIDIYPPRVIAITSYRGAGMSLLEFIKTYPLESAIKISFKVFSGIAGILFFYGGLALFAIMFKRMKPLRIEILVLLMPLFYTLAALIPVHFEQRFLATGAWVLVLPFAWYMQQLTVFRNRKE